MCGIYGFTDYDPVLIEEMTLASEYRGPDGTYFHTDEERRLSFGFNHLNINQSPLNPVVQPYKSNHSNILLFNGEIYGVREPDTLWLSRNLDTFGPKIVATLNGMWSIAWYEESTQRIHLIRDHFGTKPLFYTIIDNVLYFASSIKSLVGIPGINTDIDSEMLEIYEEFGNYIPGPRTLYKNIHKVAPGQHLVWSMRQKRFIIDESTFANKLHNIDSTSYDPMQVRNMITHSIREASCNEYKTAVQLSGGLDSSTVIASLHDVENMKLQCYTTSFDYTGRIRVDVNVPGAYDQSPIAHQTASYFNVGITDVVITDVEYETDKAMEIQDFFGLPIQDRARWYPRIRLAQKAAAEGCRVMLNGDLGDELFEPTHNLNLRANQYAGWSDKAISYLRSWFPEHVLGSDLDNNKRFIDAIVFGEMYHALSDTTAAYCGMESRPVFAHQALAFAAFDIPSKIKWRPEADYMYIFMDMEEHGIQRLNKPVMRQALGAMLPPHVHNNPWKVGWSVPWNAKRHPKLKSNVHADLAASVRTAKAALFKTSKDIR